MGCMRAGMLAPFLAGAAVILPAGGRFSASTFWRDAVEFGATFYTAVPTMHQVGLECMWLHRVSASNGCCIAAQRPCCLDCRQRQGS